MFDSYEYILRMLVGLVGLSLVAGLAIVVLASALGGARKIAFEQTVRERAVRRAEAREADAARPQIAAYTGEEE